MLSRTRPRALVGGVAVLLVPAGCAISSHGTFTVDGAKHHATSVRCSVVGYDNTIDIRSSGYTAQVVIRDQTLAEAVEVRVTRDGRPTWAASVERGIGTTRTTRMGLRFMVRADVVEVDDRGEPTGEREGGRPITFDVTCAQLH